MPEEVVLATDTELYEAGRAHMAAGELEAAHNALRLSAEANPHFKTLELLGECLLKLGRPKEAIVPLAAASALNAGIRAPSLLAQAFLALGEHGRAAHFASRVLTLAPGNRPALEVLSNPAVQAAAARAAGV